jgi:3',5'-cyclic AMP phosphodiesterase CpdA
MILIAHLSDTHFDGHERNHSRAQLVMDYLNALPGTARRHRAQTGDITDHGTPRDEEAAKTLVSAIPVHTCPATTTATRPMTARSTARVEVGRAVLLMADSVIQGRDEGRAFDETLDWLATELASVQGRPPGADRLPPPAGAAEPRTDRRDQPRRGRRSAAWPAHGRTPQRGRDPLRPRPHSARPATFARASGARRRRA